ncbi:hypothetical protein ACIQU6_30635 [Streptomyces sp. NPDC090442]|uniref:hypothetical protein n=1 Tax=Streptomyces sp. NPDC090442 TaxID=3365962 RepID=UPI0037F8EC00
MSLWLLALATYAATVALLGGLGLLASAPPGLAVPLIAVASLLLGVLGWIAHLAVWLLPVALLRTWFLDRIGHRAA